MLKKIDHISIVVSDIEEAAEFFTHFGFFIEDDAVLEGEWISSIVGLEKVKARYMRLSLPDSESRLELMEYYSPIPHQDAETGRANKIGIRHLAFEVKDIDAIVLDLEARGMEFLSPVQSYERYGKKLVYFYGPDGILLELAEYS